MEQKVIDINQWSRPGTRLKGVMAVVMHWTGVPGQDADAVRNFFQNRKCGMTGYGSAHYVVGLDGTVIQCIPENEVAYHCGSSKPDPASGKIYTDYARDAFGAFAKDYMHLSPNLVTIGIELCTTDSAGHFSEQTITAAVQLVADILKRHSLTVKDITTHHSIVGWKECPKLWTEKPELFEAFRQTVRDYIVREYIA